MKPTTVHNEYVAMKNFKLLSIKENNPSQKRKSLQNGKKSLYILCIQICKSYVPLLLKNFYRKLYI